MKHINSTADFVAVLAALASPAYASTPATASPMASCPALAEARAHAHAAAEELHYRVFDFDGEQARLLQEGQKLPVEQRSDHVTVMVNPTTGRAAMLLGDGPGCAFYTVLAIATGEAVNEPLKSALDILRLPQ